MNKYIKKIYKIALSTSAILTLPISATAQSFSIIQTEASDKLASAITELATLQESISTEKVPLAKKLNSLEVEVSNLKEDLRRMERLRDTRDLNLSALEAEVKARRDEIDYAKNLLVEFINNQSSSADAADFNCTRRNF